MKIGIIAGSGQFPIIFSKAARNKGYSVFITAIVGETDAAIENYANAVEWVEIGQFERMIKFFNKNKVKEAVFLGAVNKTRIFKDVKPDMTAISIVSNLRHTNDDELLRAFAAALEKRGIIIRASTFLLPELLALEGCWTGRKPDPDEKSDIDLGFYIAKQIGRLDIGQSVVISGGSVLAVEAIDGTDATLKRGGMLSRGKAVAVKVSKPDQDLRFDVPAIGVETVRVMHEAQITALGVEAGKTVVFDKNEMVALADKYGISIVALSNERETSEQ
jgi:DUF1009 family protein